MKKSLRLEYLYHDVDIIEVLVSAWNGRFGGATRLYVGRGELMEAAAAIKGFPNSPVDHRELVLGAFGSGSAGGAVRLILSCIDLAGHAQLRLDIEAEYRDGTTPESAHVVARIEAAAVDLLVPQLRLIEANLDGEAVLQFADL